jgi:hypothetical protein
MLYSMGLPNNLYENRLKIGYSLAVSEGTAGFGRNPCERPTGNVGPVRHFAVACLVGKGMGTLTGHGWAVFTRYSCVS